MPDMVVVIFRWDVEPRAHIYKRTGVAPMLLSKSVSHHEARLCRCHRKGAPRGLLLFLPPPHLCPRLEKKRSSSPTRGGFPRISEASALRPPRRIRTSVQTPEAAHCKHGQSRTPQQLALFALFAFCRAGDQRQSLAAGTNAERLPESVSAHDASRCASITETGDHVHTCPCT